MTLRLKSLLLAALLGLAPVASADQARIERLTDLLVQAIPMGSIFETLADADQNWPAPDYAPLRRLADIGNAFDAGASAEENEASGEAAGSDMATRVMLGAMSACDVPTSVLFE